MSASSSNQFCKEDLLSGINDVSQLASELLALIETRKKTVLQESNTASLKQFGDILQEINRNQLATAIRKLRALQTVQEPVNRNEEGNHHSAVDAACTALQKVCISNLEAKPRPGPSKAHRWIFFDLETTGLSTKKDRIVEIAALEPESGRSFSTLVNPLPRSVTSAARQASGLGMAQLTRPDVPIFHNAGQRFVSFVNEVCQGAVPILVAHNGLRYDFPLLLCEFTRAGLEWPSSWMYLDTLLVARTSIALKMAAGDLKLVTLRQHFKVAKPTAEHRALDDVKVLSAILPHVLRAAEFPVKSAALVAHWYHTQFRNKYMGFLSHFEVPEDMETYPLADPQHADSPAGSARDSWDLEYESTSTMQESSTAAGTSRGQQQQNSPRQQARIDSRPQPARTRSSANFRASAGREDMMLPQGTRRAVSAGLPCCQGAALHETLDPQGRASFSMQQSCQEVMHDAREGGLVRSNNSTQATDGLFTEHNGMTSVLPRSLLLGTWAVHPRQALGKYPITGQPHLPVVVHLEQPIKICLDNVVVHSNISGGSTHKDCRFPTWPTIILEKAGGQDDMDMLALMQGIVQVRFDNIISPNPASNTFVWDSFIKDVGGRGILGLRVSLMYRTEKRAGQLRWGLDTEIWSENRAGRADRIVPTFRSCSEDAEAGILDAVLSHNVAAANGALGVGSKCRVIVQPSHVWEANGKAGIKLNLVSITHYYSEL